MRSYDVIVVGGEARGEARQQLARDRPATLGQADRIPGISPSDLQNLLVELKKRGLDVGPRGR